MGSSLSVCSLLGELKEGKQVDKRIDQEVLEKMVETKVHLEMKVAGNFYLLFLNILSYAFHDSNHLFEGLEKTRTNR